MTVRSRVADRFCKDSMPNTLAHFAVHGLITRRLLPKADLAWIYLGCVIPDLPWIGQRLAKVLLPALDVVSIRLYAINQASLFVSLLLCAGLALLTQNSRRIFAILGLGSLLHLLLDACQIKWGNGVSLMVPVDWRLLRFDLFWPESRLNDLLTVGGLVYFGLKLRAAASFRPRWSRNLRRWGLAAVLAACYLTFPLLWLQPATEANNHFVRTLRDSGKSTGEVFEIDRSVYRDGADGGTLDNLTGNDLVIPRLQLADGTKVSVRGRILGAGRGEVTDLHVHRSRLRDGATILGLALLASLWLWCVFAPTLFLRRKPGT